MELNVALLTILCVNRRQKARFLEQLHLSKVISTRNLHLQHVPHDPAEVLLYLLHLRIFLGHHRENVACARSQDMIADHAGPAR
jgi:hypothetical protein